MKLNGQEELQVTILAIHRVSLSTHDLAKAQEFFESHLGLGRAVRLADQTLAFGSGSRGLRVRKSPRLLTRTGSEILGSAGVRHVAFETDDINEIASKLDRAAIPYVHALPGDFDTPAIYTIDPAMNVVAFCQKSTDGPADQGIQSLLRSWGWGIHHVNLEASDVREAAAFYVEIAGMTEGRWQAPAEAGDVTVDPTLVSLLPLGDFNRGIHIVRADPSFPTQYSLAHNPTIGGHPAFSVRDVHAVKARLERDGVLVSDAKVYAMDRMYQIYFQDPSANMIEVNQFV
jgi:catechol 2,3-dioxygenase-like lactoylglutathione lyase family enzyme